MNLTQWKFPSRTLVVLCTALLAPGDALLYAQPGEPGLAPRQLDSLVVPIALYPDPLLAQILAASTYPLQVTEAGRWLEANSLLKGEQLVQEAGRQDWDPSIRALVVFPSVLQQMDQNLSWTTSLGNAFLAQQEDTMAAIRRMRQTAYAAGKITSKAQQKVDVQTVDGQSVIVIQPADPQVVYVPSYNPAVCVCARAAANAQKSFPTAEAAAQALLAAAEARDEALLLLLFGPDGKDVLSSGDPVQDKNYRAAFVAKAKASMKLEKDPMNKNRVTIAIGDDDFPFAIPLIRASDSQWRFDMDEGKFEVLARRIGSNELDAIAVCSGYVEAQYEYAAADHGDDNVRQYAQKFISSPGKQDGLYWPQSPNTPVSPMQRGLMIGGFALIAWPAEYGVSGIKSFVVNQDGVIYDKDLGPDTGQAAQAVMRFNPDKTWHALR